MPAQYGGRLFSVVDIAMKEGDQYKTQIDAGIGLIASRFSIQDPLKKTKLSIWSQPEEPMGMPLLNPL